MSNVLDFNKKKVTNKEEESKVLFEAERLAVMETYEKDEFELVADNEISAMVLSSIILDTDENISHVEQIRCKSRVGHFIKLNPVMKTEKDIVYVPNSLASSYLSYLETNDLIEIDENGIILVKNNPEGDVDNE